MNLVECLMKTGLTRNESELYIALCREGELTGYEAAKLTGIPRANAYQALAGLADKGGAIYNRRPGAALYGCAGGGILCNVLFHIEEVTEMIKGTAPECACPPNHI